MAVNFNMNMGSLLKGLTSNTGGRSNNFLAQYKIAIAIFMVTILLVAGYVFALYMPALEANRQKSAELDKMIEMQKQLTALDIQINTLKKKLDKSKEQYLASLTRFGNSEDLGTLYQTISTLAEKYNIVVLNIKEIAPEAPKTKGKVAEKKDEKKDSKTDNKADGKSIEAKTDAKKDKKTAASTEKPKTTIDVKEIRVDVELKGDYVNYIKFKEDLAIAEILLKVNTETVMVKDDKDKSSQGGGLYVKLNLSTYAIDKKPFEGIITEKENDKTS